MNTFKKAIIGIVRQPFKNLAFLLLIIFLGNFLLIGITMNRSLIVTEERLLMRLPAVTTLVYTRNSPRIENQPTQDEIMRLGSSLYVLAYDFTLQFFFNSHEMNYISAMDPGVFTGRGVNNTNVADIESGLIKLVEGRTFTQEEIDNNELVMVIPQSIATVNGLSIGSIIEVANVANDYRYRGSWSNRLYEPFVLDVRYLEFEVIGIFIPDIEEGESYFREPTLFYIPFGIAEDMLNFILQAMIEEDEDVFRSIGQGIFVEDQLLDTLFVLNSPRYLESFIESSKEILPDGWIASGIDIAVFEPIVNLMDLILDVANGIQFFAIITAAVTISLSLLLILRDRRYEIGIYLALGVKKVKLILQIITEVAVVSFIGLIITILTGNLISSNISNSLLRQYLSEGLEEQRFITGDTPWQLTLHIPNQMPLNEAMELFDISLNSNAVFILLLTGILVIVFATIVPVVLIIKIEPKKLLFQAKIG